MRQRPAKPSVEARALELVGDIQGLLELEEFRAGLVEALRRAVPSDYASFNELGADGPIFTLAVPELPQSAHDAWGRWSHQNPLLRLTRGTGDGSVTRFSDVIAAEDLRRLEIYRELYEPLGIEHQMAFTLPYRPPRVLGVALSRGGRDFSDAERDLIRLARPYLIQGYRNAIDYTAACRAAEAGADLTAALRRAGLTEREAQVMRLVARGSSNRDAAAALEVSVRTVQKHLERAYATLAVRSRSAAARRASKLAGAE